MVINNGHVFFHMFSDEIEDLKSIAIHPVHLKPDKEGSLPPSALIPFCSYQGDSDILGSQSPMLDNETMCDQFEPTILEGQLCYSLDTIKLKGKTKSGKANGLFLLLDPFPYRPNITEENVLRFKDKSFKIHIHTLAQFTTFGPGSYEMSALKKMTGTATFMQLPEENRMCSVNVQNREDCQTQKYLEEVETECNCIPWALRTNKERISLHKKMNSDLNQSKFLFAGCPFLRP